MFMEYRTAFTIFQCQCHENERAYMSDETPNQWWRFITPIFLHAGFVHILLNLLAQLTAGAQVRLNLLLLEVEHCLICLLGREGDGLGRLLPALLRRRNIWVSDCCIMKLYIRLTCLASYAAMF